MLAIALGMAVLQVLPPAARGGARPDAVGFSAATASAATVPATSPSNATLVADPATPTIERTRGGVACTTPHRVVNVDHETAIHATPGGRSIATLPARSRYLDQPVVAWVQATSADGRWGKVSMPWSKPVTRSGWIRIDGMRGGVTRTLVVSDLSDRTITVYEGCRPMLRVQSAIGRPGSPSPTGRFWVTDRVIVPSAQRASFGTFAFGLSTIQPNLPVGWTGGNQMAIHGTGAPGSIGQAASAGCLRVSEYALGRLKPYLLLGTPVVIQA